MGGAGCAHAPRHIPHVNGIRAITHKGGCGGTVQDAWTLCRMLAAYADPAPLLESLAQSVAPADDCRREVVELFRGLSALDPGWTRRLERCPAVPGWDPAAEPWLERFALYLVYRYFLKSCLDGNVLGRGKWMTAVCLLLFALSRGGTDPVLLAREWSKNVEYCPANLDRLDLAVQKLSASSLLGILVSL